MADKTGYFTLQTVDENYYINKVSKSMNALLDWISEHKDKITKEFIIMELDQRNYFNLEYYFNFIDNGEIQYIEIKHQPAENFILYDNGYQEYRPMIGQDRQQLADNAADWWFEINLNSELEDLEYKIDIGDAPIGMTMDEKVEWVAEQTNHMDNETYLNHCDFEIREITPLEAVLFYDYFSHHPDERTIVYDSIFRNREDRVLDTVIQQFNREYDTEYHLGHIIPHKIIPLDISIQGLEDLLDEFAASIVAKELAHELEMTIGQIQEDNEVFHVLIDSELLALGSPLKVDLSSFICLTKDSTRKELIDALIEHLIETTEYLDFETILLQQPTEDPTSLAYQMLVDTIIPNALYATKRMGEWLENIEEKTLI